MTRVSSLVDVENIDHFGALKPIGMTLPIIVILNIWPPRYFIAKSHKGYTVFTSRVAPGQWLCALHL